ncbi:hypothetical protein HDU76_006705, partial [Blyttiomyces sp. JEL0837]
MIRCSSNPVLPMHDFGNDVGNLSNMEFRLSQVMSKRVKELDVGFVETLLEDVLEVGFPEMSEAEREKKRRLSHDEKVQEIKKYAMKTGIIPLTISTTIHQPQSTNKQDPDYARTPDFFIDALKSLVTSLSTNRTLAAQFVQLVTRGINAGGGTGVGGVGVAGNGYGGLKEVLVGLREMCLCGGNKWLVRFLDLDGLRVMFEILDVIHRKTDRKSKYNDAEMETLKILKIILNHQKEMADLLSKPNWFKTLSLSLDSPTITARTSTLDFFLALVAIDYLVIQSFKAFQNEKRDSRIFESLVKMVDGIVESRGKFGTSVGSRRDFLGARFGVGGGGSSGSGNGAMTMLSGIGSGSPGGNNGIQGEFSSKEIREFL